MTSEGALTQTLREFVINNFLFGEVAACPTDDESLMDRGVVDSTGVLEVVSFVEERFGIQVTDSELIPENLDSISSIAGFVQRKVG